MAHQTYQYNFGNKNIIFYYVDLSYKNTHAPNILVM